MNVREQTEKTQPPIRVCLALALFRSAQICGPCFGTPEVSNTLDEVGSGRGLLWSLPSAFSVSFSNALRQALLRPSKCEDVDLVNKLVAPFTPSAFRHEGSSSNGKK
jgi:hypothetical protein